jgi:hypothetical protein
MRNRLERTSRNQLRSYWDHYVAGDRPSPDAVPSDPGLAETVRQIHDRDYAVDADSAFAASLLEHLMRAAPQEPLPRTLEQAVSQRSVNGRRAPLPLFGRERDSEHGQRQWPLGQIAAAVLFAVTIFAFLIAIQPWDDGPGPNPAVVASPTAEATPTVVTETLIDLTFPAGSIPVGDEGFAVFNRYSMFGEEHLSYPDTCDTPRFVVGLIESGQVTARLDGPLDVVRGPNAAQPGAREAIAPPTEVTLATGDVYLYANTTGDLLEGFLNPGPTQPAVVLEVAWFTTIDCIAGPPDGMNLVWDSYDDTPAVDQTRPIRFLLQRVSTQPGGVLTDGGAGVVGNIPDADSVFERVYVEAGTLGVTGLPPEESATPQPGSEMFFGALSSVGDVAAVKVDVAPDDQPLVLRNTGEGILVTTILTVSYGPP